MENEKKKSHQDKNVIKAFQMRYLPKKISGQIDKKELAAVVKKLLPDISSNQITHLMKTCDEDKSGKISYTEFIRFLGQRSSQTSHYAYAQDL